MPRERRSLIISYLLLGLLCDFLKKRTNTYTKYVLRIKGPLGTTHSVILSVRSKETETREGEVTLVTKKGSESRTGTKIGMRRI